ncbi:unnamed protein product [Adineta steineri]|uniref:Uncharacterized protein n=1 Tax=Adineta steineri TaxID=433720 RepID=A0A819GTD2_9BILA|nr:unnamed protein product [Adineta steineri]CAF3888877.1 unnamed protein product [Adineta steineri]
MSSFVIGLDITDSHVTSVLVRVEQISNKKKLSIEHDTYFTRLYEINLDTDPRDIISIWIQCIDDLLLDFTEHYHDNDNIIGISIGIPGPMDYESGICYAQLSIFHKFFGLNLRLSFENGIKDLIARWKYDYYDKYHAKSTVSLHKKLSIFDNLQQGQKTRKMTITSPITPQIPITLNILSATLEDVREKNFTNSNILDYCGRHDNDEYFYNDEECASIIPRSRRETYFHDVESKSSEKPELLNRFTSKLLTIIEQLGRAPISFYNDATCLGLGEAINDYNQDYKRILALTLGSSFGSVFIDQGEIIRNREDVPLNGVLWNCPYDQNSIADDWFSVRGLINVYKKLLRSESPDDSSGTSSMTLSTDEQQQYDDNLSINEQYLARRASNGDPIAIKAFQIFARLLGQFLIPYINAFHAQLIIISGNLSQVWYLLEDELNLTIQKFSQVQVYFSLSQGKSVCLGAVQQQSLESPKHFSRQIHQPLLPVVKTIDTSKYDIYPSHQIPSGSIGIGHRTLNEKLFDLIEEKKVLLIDGFVGTYFNEYAQQINKYYTEKKKGKKSSSSSSSLLFYDSRAFLQTDSNLQRQIYLQDPQSLFGRVASDLDFQKDFLDLKKLNFLKNNLSHPCIIIGPGSSYINETSPVIYIDLAKNELYYRAATETSFSYLKPTEKMIPHDNQLTSTMYEQKCLYFLDYPIFNKLKQELLPRINYFIDGQRPNCPTWIDGNSFRHALKHIANEPLRVRPWFQSGSWGGQWLKTVCENISKHAKNYAWSYEMITSENGLILSDKYNHLIELSWDIFYGSQFDKILGNDIHCRLFNGSNDFPIRFNFLDTIDGGNLSLQCTPNLQYMRTNFGEKLPQDETYYIIETKQHWKEECQNDKSSSAYIYLDFHKNINSEEFHHDLILSEIKKEYLNIDKYIQCIPTHIHDYFLIPNETIHASGRNQVVLEISSTPYLYTFKLYDWLRSNFDGHSQILSIEHGMKNLKFNQQNEQLQCQPISIKIEQDKYEEQHLPTHNLHIFDVQRLIIEPNENIEIFRLTENRFHLCMLVQGDAIEIQYNSIDNNNHQKQIRQYNYIETFLIPSSIKEYRLRPIIKNKDNVNKSQKLILLISFLKWDCEKLLE